MHRGAILILTLCVVVFLTQSSPNLFPRGRSRFTVHGASEAEKLGSGDLCMSFGDFLRQTSRPGEIPTGGNTPCSSAAELLKGNSAGCRQRERASKS